MRGNGSADRAECSAIRSCSSPWVGPRFCPPFGRPYDHCSDPSDNLCLEINLEFLELQRVGSPLRTRFFLSLSFGHPPDAEPIRSDITHPAIMLPSVNEEMVTAQTDDPY